MAYLFLRGNAPDSLLMLQYGCPLSRVLLTDWLWQLFSAAGIFGNFSSHSFHIGAATGAACNGFPDHLIQALGRWSSNAYQLCMRKPAEALASLSQETDLTRSSPSQRGESHWWSICAQMCTAVQLPSLFGKRAWAAEGGAWLHICPLLPECKAGASIRHVLPQGWALLLDSCRAPSVLRRRACAIEGGAWLHICPLLPECTAGASVRYVLPQGWALLLDSCRAWVCWGSSEVPLLENYCVIVAGKLVTWSESWTLYESLGTVWSFGVVELI